MTLLFWWRMRCPGISSGNALNRAQVKPFLPILWTLAPTHFVPCSEHMISQLNTPVIACTAYTVAPFNCLWKCFMKYSGEHVKHAVTTSIVTDTNSHNMKLSFILRTMFRVTRRSCSTEHKYAALNSILSGHNSIIPFQKLGSYIINENDPRLQHLSIHIHERLWQHNM